MKTTLATVALSLISTFTLADQQSITVLGTRQPVVYSDSGAGPDATPPFTSNRTRAEVVAEMLAAPSVPGWVDGYAFEMASNTFVSLMTREEVRQEMLLAQAQGNDFHALGMAHGGN